MASFADRFKQIRKSYSLRQEEIADQLGVSKNTISVWERGLRLPEGTKLEKICREYNVAMAWLLGGDVVEEPEEPDDDFFAQCSQEEDDRWLAHITHLIAQLSPESREIVASTVAKVYKMDKRKGRLDIRKACRVKLRFENLTDEGDYEVREIQPEEVSDSG